MVTESFGSKPIIFFTTVDFPDQDPPAIPIVNIIIVLLWIIFMFKEIFI